MKIKTTKTKVTNPRIAADILLDILSAESGIDRDKEHFWVIGLNTNNTIRYIELVTLGLIDGSLIHPREVFRFAVMKAVSSIIIGHNHPSGNIEPSKEDMAITKQLRQAGKIVGIEVVDHVIIGNGYLSMLERKLL